MKVLHLAPLWFPVAQDSPGGIETFLTALIGALHGYGCENALLASGDSRTAADLIPAVEVNLWERVAREQAWDHPVYEQHQLLLAIENWPAFDVVHSHLGHSGYVLSGVRGLADRLLHTHHNVITPDVEWFVERHPHMRLSTVSQFQARKLRARGATGCQVVPNGLELANFPYEGRGEDGLVFMGRVKRSKGPDIAIRVARKLGRELQLAGPIADQEFFEQEIEPWLDTSIRYLGIVGHDRKTQLLGGATCVLMPSRWEEPFGLVAVEAMACGTPVVALGSGALPELIESGVGGFVTNDEEELPSLVTRAMELDRARVRASVSRRFEISQVARRYLELYAEIVEPAPSSLSGPL
jgi:glycosyltransferase involved in cell wall biosynthesis